MRDVLVHYHLFKNAGSSVDAILARHFGASWAKLDAAQPWARVHDSELAELLTARPLLRAISSHQARPPGPGGGGLRIHPLLFLRHPIDRVGSVYEFERRMPREASPGAAMANDLGFADYVDWRMQDGDGGTICNFQTLFLGWREGDTSSGAAARRARDLVLTLPGIGLVEQFEPSIARISAALEPVFGVLPKLPAAVNRASNRSAGLQDRIESIRASLGASRYQRLCDSNALDLELHALATARFRTA